VHTFTDSDLSDTDNNVLFN